MVTVPESKIVKNKIAPPFKEAEFDIMFGKGISKEGDILDLAVKCDLVRRAAHGSHTTATRSVRDEKMRKSYPVSEHPEIMDEIEQKVPCTLTSWSGRSAGRTEEAAADGN